jgi:hypothetical protein
MSEQVKVMRLAFENWVLNAMHDLDESLLHDFDQVDGYTKSETINSVWVGFAAAFQLYAIKN